LTSARVEVYDVNLVPARGQLARKLAVDWKSVKVLREILSGNPRIVV
jgi:hypothetical protein